MGQAPQVLRFRRDGRLVGSYGSAGEGPGEFRHANWAWQSDDTTIAVVAGRPPVLIEYDLDSGEFRQQLRLPGTVTDIHVGEDALWLGRVSYAQHKGVARLDRATERLDWLVNLPQGYQDGGPLGGIFGRVNVVGWRDTLLVGFEPTSYLLVVARGQVVDTIIVPRQLRRGVPPDPGQHLATVLRNGPYPEVFGALSALRALHRQPDGTIVLAYYDHRPGSLPVSSDVYLSLISSDLRATCVEAAVPLAPDTRPILGFAGDTLMVLEQQVHGLDVAVVVTLYVVDAEGCDWEN